MQPVELDNGTPRFKANAIVRFLLDAGPYDMNKLAKMPWSDEACDDACHRALELKERQ
jgi:hypothetical protein